MQDPTAETAGWRLEIADGPNAGATVTLVPGRYRFGSGTVNEIVLADPAITAEHATMEFASDRASIIAHAEGVQLRRRHLDSGRRYNLRPGAVVTLGGTRMRLAGPPSMARERRGGRLMTCLIALVVACTGGAYEVSAPRAVGASQTASDRPSTASGMTLERSAIMFRTHLADAHVASGITLRAGDAVVLATGTILPADRAAWLDARKWFDRHLGGQYALSDRVDVVPSAELPTLDVAAVSMMPVPNVITRDGEHYTVGAVLPNGWSIAGIAANAITLRSGDHQIRIDL
jgi:hypothetical protein